VTTISEKKRLAKMSLVALFGKLQEHELELSQLEQHEEVEKKHKTISLKAELNVNQQEDSLKEDDNINLLVKIFGKFLNKDKTIKFSQGERLVKNKETSTSNQNFTCFVCGKQSHIKVDCPTLQKKYWFKGKIEKRSKKEYIAQEDNAISSYSDS